MHFHQKKKKEEKKISLIFAFDIWFQLLNVSVYQNTTNLITCRSLVMLEHGSRILVSIFEKKIRGKYIE